MNSCYKFFFQTFPPVQLFFISFVSVYRADTCVRYVNMCHISIQGDWGDFALLPPPPPGSLSSLYTAGGSSEGSSAWGGLTDWDNRLQNDRDVSFQKSYQLGSQLLSPSFPHTPTPLPPPSATKCMCLHTILSKLVALQWPYGIWTIQFYTDSRPPPPPPFLFSSQTNLDY